MITTCLLLVWSLNSGISRRGLAFAQAEFLMKFRFCGGLDAPDWILAEVSVLSKMSSVRVKLISKQILQQLRGAGIDYEKVTKLTTSQRLNLGPGDVKAIMAALHFMLRNSAKYDVDEDTLLQELPQLGLPLDICQAIVKEFIKVKDNVRQHFATQTLRLPRIEETEWRVDYILSSSLTKVVAEPAVSLKLKLSKDANDANHDGSASSDQLVFSLSADKFRVLLNELKTVRQSMENIST
eukprot:g72497.t1